MVKQYQIYWIDLDPTIGSEINKKRPCVILSPNEMNYSMNTVIVAPLTSTIKKYPTRILTDINGKKGQIAIDQLKCIDKKRINNFIGKLEIETISEIKEIINKIFILE